MKLMRTRQFGHQVLTAFMAAWLSGFLLLFCCIGLDSGGIDMVSVSMVGMPADCPMQSAQESDADLAQSTGKDCVDCCGFLTAVLDKERKYETGQSQIAIPENIAVEIPTVQSVVSYRETVFRRTPYLPDKQHTFLRNCVFRI